MVNGMSDELMSDTYTKKKVQLGFFFCTCYFTECQLSLEAQLAAKHHPPPRSSQLAHSSELEPISFSTMSDVRRAIALYDSKQYAIALPLFQAVLRRCEQKPDGASSAETASLVFKIGYCYDKLSDF